MYSCEGRKRSCKEHLSDDESRKALSVSEMDACLAGIL